MDIFKFTNPNEATKMEQGEIINGFTSKLWVERFRREGEFKLIAPVDSEIRKKLPLGSFISHVDSTEIMIVENHEINESKGQESEIVITGRGFETFLENRTVGSNKTFPISGVISDYVLSSAYSWQQVVELISDHIYESELVNGGNSLPYVELYIDSLDVGEVVERTVSRGPVYDRVIELLSIDNLGIKVIRPGPWSPLTAGSPNAALVIHKGEDRTDSVIFSYDSDELESADYLWSNKRKKNAALVTGKWVEIDYAPDFGIELVNGIYFFVNKQLYNRRMMYINASDIDEIFESAPTGGDLTAVVAAMQQRAIDVLASQNELALTKAQISKEAVRYVYRTDFNVGDRVTVSGDYNEVSTMRITEYVEAEDENGESGYPTLDMDDRGYTEYS